jgi:hypothetical protein
MALLALIILSSFVLVDASFDWLSFRIMHVECDACASQLWLQQPVNSTPSQQVASSILLHHPVRQFRQAISLVIQLFYV